MSAKRPVAWVVASATVSRRWARALNAAGIAAHPLVWGAPAAPPAPRALIRSLWGGFADLVLITSHHALTFLPADAGRGLRAACVGPGCAAAARARGFDVVLVGTAGAGHLAQRIVAERPSVRRVLFLAGRDARLEGPATLEAAGLEVRTDVAYVMRRHAGFEAAVRDAPEPDVVVVGSPRAFDTLQGAAKGVRRDALERAPLVVPGAVTAAHVERRSGRRPSVAGAADADGVVTAVRSQLACERP